jgi:ribosome-associated protein
MARRNAPHEEIENQYQRPSRSQMKRDATALQELGARLAELPKERLQGLDLPEELGAALIAYAALRSHEAKRRHLQYVGKLMRAADIEPLEAALAELDNASRAQTELLHKVEGWRERLLAAEPKERAQLAAEIAAELPGLAPERLAQLAAEARTERDAKKPPRSFRVLFKLLRDAAAQPEQENDE